MLLLLFLLLLNTSHILPSDAKPLSGKKIKVTFDNTNATEEYPLEYLNYFVTAKNMLEDLGSPTEMPLHNVSKRTFDCLTAFAKAFHDGNNNFQKAETTFSDIINQYADVFDVNLLKSTDYLDFTFEAFDSDKDMFITLKMVDEIIPLYANVLKKRPFWITDSDAILPRELKLATPTLLLEDLLTIVKPVIKKTSINLEAGSDAYPLTVSTSGSRYGFGCVINDGKTSEKSQGLFRDFFYGKVIEIKTGFSYAYTSLFPKHNLLSKQNIALNGYSSSNGSIRCAVSEDGNFMLITSRQPENYRAMATLYNLSNPKKNSSGLVEPVDTVNLDISSENIDSILFDEIKSIFNILAYDNNKFLYLYQATPSTTKLFVNQISLSHSYQTQMTWSCINGQLIGVPYSSQTSTVIYDETPENFERLKTVQSINDNPWFYKGKVKHKADFSVIKFAMPFRTLSTVAIQRSFIPSFETRLCERLGADSEEVNLGQATTAFDPKHLCVYFALDNEEAGSPATMGIKYPWKQKLTMAVNLLNKRVLNGELNITVDAYFLYHYYTHRDRWRIYCAKILDQISPEIKALYNLDKAE